MLKQPVASVRLTNVAVVRLKRGGQRYEVACFKNKALNFRGGTEPNLQEVLQTEQIFTNVSKGEVAKSSDLKKHFPGLSNAQVAKEILRTGELQVSEKEREAEAGKRLRDVATFVAGRLFNTATRLPLSTNAAEALLKEIGFSVRIDSPVKPTGLKALQLVCDAFPNDVARTQMLIRLTFSCGARCNAVTEFLDSIDASLYDDPSNEESSCVAFYCDPLHYRAVDSFASAHGVTLNVLSSRECVCTKKRTVEDSK